MGKIKGVKQKPRPKLKDKKQSERFKEAAREHGADESTDALERVLTEMATPKYEIYRHKIYNARGMIKSIDAPFPAQLVADEWKRIAKAAHAFDAALSDI